MSNVNKIILIGNLGKDPEIRYLENGRARTTFTLATNESYKNKEGKKVGNTQWHNITFWSPTAEFAAKYLRKGSHVYIEGKITYRTFSDKEGDIKHITEIIGQQLGLLGPGKEGEHIAPTTETMNHVNETPKEKEDNMDDLPF